MVSEKGTISLSSSKMEYLTLLTRDEEECITTNSYNGKYMGARISSVFVILACSSFGAFFPLLSSRYSMIKLPPVCFFIAKYFGSGVIIATALVHLLDPATESLGQECLGAPFTEYPMALGLCLIMVFVMFVSEILAYRWLESRMSAEQDDAFLVYRSIKARKLNDKEDCNNNLKKSLKGETRTKTIEHDSASSSIILREENDACDEGCCNEDLEMMRAAEEQERQDKYFGNILNVFVLEFGIIFHSIFIGLSLACSGDEFLVLYVVLVFHQTFEGLGLGTRIALVEWPKTRKRTPWVLAALYGLTTPGSIAVGLGVRTMYAPNSRAALITNGVCDSLSAGILIYTSFMELMSHEVMENEEFRGKKGFKKMMSAVTVMACGAGLMALLAKWA